MDNTGKTLKSKLTYKHLRPYLSNNDKVLFRGKGGVSLAIMWVCSIGYIINPLNWGKGFLKGIHTKYSHCGSLVVVPWQKIAELLKRGDLPADVVDKRVDDGKENAVFILESTSINGGFKGVQLRLFSEVLKSYKGRIVIRKLRTDNAPNLDQDINFINMVLGTPYEKQIGELFRSAIDVPGIEQKADLSSIFCAELNALRDQSSAWRLLPENPPANEYTPENYREGDLVDKKMINGKLGNEIEIVSEEEYNREHVRQIKKANKQVAKAVEKANRNRQRVSEVVDEFCICFDEYSYAP
jgi:hypothetical protein